MARTDSTKVATIVEVDTSIDLTAFIETANELVTEVCVPLGYTATRLELIERWLAAHFYRMRDPALAGEGAAGLSQNFQYSVGLNLSQTREGQQAMLLDTKGGLASLNKSTEDPATKPVRSIGWLGKEE